MLAFDVSVPSSPVLMRAYTTPSRGGGQGNGISVVRDVVHSRDIIYTGGYFAGLVVLQTKDTEAPNIQITDPTTLPGLHECYRKPEPGGHRFRQRGLDACHLVERSRWWW